MAIWNSMKERFRDGWKMGMRARMWKERYQNLTPGTKQTFNTYEFFAGGNMSYLGAKVIAVDDVGVTIAPGCFVVSERVSVDSTLDGSLREEFGLTPSRHVESRGMYILSSKKRIPYKKMRHPHERF